MTDKRAPRRRSCASLVAFPLRATRAFATGHQCYVRYQTDELTAHALENDLSRSHRFRFDPMGCRRRNWPTLPMNQAICKSTPRTSLQGVTPAAAGRVDLKPAAAPGPGQAFLECRAA